MGDVDKVGDGVLRNKIGPIMIAEVEVGAGRGRVFISVVV